MTAIDYDSHSTLLYTIDPYLSEARNEDGGVVRLADYNYTQAFDMNPSNGVIRAARWLDRETVENIKLSIKVQDLASENGLQTATSKL